MSRLWLLLVFLASLAVAPLAVSQTAPTSSAGQEPTQHPAQAGAEGHGSSAQSGELPPTTAVITIKGYCETPKAGADAAAKAECQTIITRAEFEKLADSLIPNMSPQVRRQLANQYPQLLYMAGEARKRGLDKDPHFLEMMRFQKLELLKVQLDRSLEEEAEKVPESDIKDYFEKNSKNFEQISVLRIFVPKVKQIQPKEGASAAEAEAARKDSETAMAKVADDLHARAAGGEDFDKLQKDAYEAAGLKASAPPTANSKLRRANLPASQSSVFDLKEGELSPLINDVSGFYIYKMVSHTKPVLADVQDEIRNTLRGQRLQTMRQKLQGAVSSELNQDYFGPDTPAGMPGSPRKPANRRPASTPPPTAQPKE